MACGIPLCFVYVSEEHSWRLLQAAVHTRCGARLSAWCEVLRSLSDTERQQVAPKNALSAPLWVGSQPRRWFQVVGLGWAGTADSV
jgi:hypothetical protein